jgi:hypothetical protein
MALTQPRQISARKALVYSVRATAAASPGRHVQPEQRHPEVGQEQLHQQRRALEKLHVAGHAAFGAGQLRDARHQQREPTSPPPTKAISDSATVQRAPAADCARCPRD